jgi:3-hydroxybutyryl-CoA dehydrogenase
MKTGSGFYDWTPEKIIAEKARYDGLLKEGLRIIRNEIPKIE